MNYIITGAIILLIGYFFGCFSTGYFVGKKNGLDIRSTGSGNIGTTNALRSLGAKAGALTFLGDLVKAFIPTLFVKFVFCPAMGYGDDITYLFTLLAGFGVVMGHNFPFYLHFKGGKGIAVSAAVIVVSNLHPIFIAVGLAIFILVVALTRYVSLGSLIVVWYIPIFTILYYRDSPIFPLILIVSLMFTLLAYIKHKPNIIRLIHGTENKLGEKKEKKSEEN